MREIRPEVWERISLESAKAHEAVLHGVHALETALAQPGSEDPAEWRGRIIAELDALVSRLEQYCAQSEAPGGLIAEMEFIQGRSEYVTEVERAHKEVLAAAKSLRQQLIADKDPLAPFSNLRRQAAHFTAALRNHQAREIDMIYETFWRDRVGGD